MRQSSNFLAVRVDILYAHTNIHHTATTRPVRLAICRQVQSILVKDPNEKGQFIMELKTKTGGTETMRASLANLILFIDGWTHLFPDTPKHMALGSGR